MVIAQDGSAGVNNGTSGTNGGDTMLCKDGGAIARAGGGAGGINATAGNVGRGDAGGGTTLGSFNGSGAVWLGAGGGYDVDYGTLTATGRAGGACCAYSGGASVVSTGANSTSPSAQYAGDGGSGGTRSSNAASFFVSFSILHVIREANEYRDS